MKKLYKEGENITSLSVGDILEIESGVFITIKDLVKETEEDFLDVKKINIHIKGEVISNEKSKSTTKSRRG